MTKNDEESHDSVKDETFVDREGLEERVPCILSESTLVALRAKITCVLDEEWARVEQKLTDHLVPQKTRLMDCEQRVQLALKQLKTVHAKVEEACKRKCTDLQNDVELYRAKLQCEQEERREEREWLAALWPDNVPLPSLLVPIKNALETAKRSEMKHVADDHTRQRYEALVTKRVERERIRQRLEEASHWKIVLPESVEASASHMPCFTNTHTGETVSNAPVAMLFEAPLGWNMATMDWEETLELANFYPQVWRNAACRVDNDDEGEDVDEDLRGADGDISDESKVDEGKEVTDEEDSEEDELPIDPMPARERYEDEVKRYEQLKAQVEQSAAKQRSLAMEVLTATHELFEREKEQLVEEDAVVIANERKRRIAEKEEQAAVKVKAEAEQRKVGTRRAAVVSAFARDFAVKKDQTLVVDDPVFEQELRDFAVMQRSDRLYLSMPLTRDSRIRERHRLDPDFVHIKHVESRRLDAERLEFDLLEKSSLLHEEAAAKAAELRELCEKIRERQCRIETDIAAIEASIAEMETAGMPLSPRQALTQDEEARAARQYVIMETFSSDDEVESKQNVIDAAESKQNNLFERHALLAASHKQLAVDLAVYEDSDAPFVERLRDLEKAANARMWEAQAQAQVMRARFVVERAAREEAVLEMRDRLKELDEHLEDASALPLQAAHPLERVKLEAQAERLVASLKHQRAELQARYAKEEEAKALLTSLELRSCDYVDAKLQEETKLLAERKSLWNLSFTLADELQTCRQAMGLLRRDKDPKSMQEDAKDSEMTHEDERQTNRTDDVVDKDPSLESYEANARVLDTKLQYLHQVRRFLLMCYDREDRWRALTINGLVKDTTSDEWMTSMQISRQEASMALLQTQHDEQQHILQCQIKSLTEDKMALQAKVKEVNDKMHRLQRDYQAGSESVRLQTQKVIEALSSELDESKAVHKKAELKYRSDRQELVQEHDTIRRELEERLQYQDETIDKQIHWLTAVKRELHIQRIANEDLLKAYLSLEKRRATEVNDMRFRISAQLKAMTNIAMWNRAMKMAAKEAHIDVVKMQQSIEEQQQRHKQLQRGLRLVNWRHRVTAQAILTDANLLFAFFADGIAILAGATRETNDALRDNAGIEVLAAIVRHSKQQSIRTLCARVLGELAWNANATARSLGWKAKHKWFQWMKAQSDIVLGNLTKSSVSFDAVAEEETTGTNWLADPSAPIDGISGESDDDVSSNGGKRKAKKLQFVTAWQQFDDKTFPSLNMANQESMGLSSNVLQTLVDLCRPLEPTSVKRNALHSLALIVRTAQNTSLIGRMDGSIALLVDVLKATSDVNNEEDPSMIRHAVQALANLAFRNTFNQQLIVAQGSIPLLLQLCDRAASSNDALDADVDLTLAALQALSHLSYDHVRSCEAIVEAHGMSILTKLCNSSRIRDAINLELHEVLQTYASQVIANVITLLDREESESPDRSYNVVDCILEAQAHLIESLKVEADSGGEKLNLDNQKQLNGDPSARQESKYVGVGAFVLMCASCTRSVAFHGAIVLGTIAQHDAIRAAIGAASGIDALFLLATQIDDLPMVAQATWALTNLTWNRDNHYRVARYIDHLYQLCTLQPSCQAHVLSNQHDASQHDDAVQSQDVMANLEHRQQIREHGLCILANVLFYNDANRQLVASDAKWMELLAWNVLHADGALLEHTARALCSLSYNDSIALHMGSAILMENANDSKDKGIASASSPLNGLYLFIQLCERVGHPVVQQHGVFGIINMCLHDVNKTRILAIPQAINALVTLSGHTNKDLCDPALEALELLADQRQGKLDYDVPSAQSFESIDMKKLIALLSDATNPSLVAMISDAIADKVWKRPSAQIRLRNEHGLEKLLDMCVKPSPLFPSATSGSSRDQVDEVERRVRISCLWALRNTVANNVRNQDLVNALDGVQQLVTLFDREQKDEEVVEALLAALIAVSMQHARNSQQLVQFGLDMLVSLADGVEERLEEDRGIRLPSLNPSTRASSTPKACELHGENAALARELLYLAAPYNTREDATRTFQFLDAKARRRERVQSSSASPVHRR